MWLTEKTAPGDTSPLNITEVTWFDCSVMYILKIESDVKIWVVSRFCRRDNPRFDFDVYSQKGDNAKESIDLSCTNIHHHLSSKLPSEFVSLCNPNLASFSQSDIAISSITDILLLYQVRRLTCKYDIKKWLDVINIKTPNL